MARAYFHDRGEDRRDEVVTTIFSHPCDGACPATAGYKVVTLMPGPERLPGARATEGGALSERTAAIMITNPEDTGIFNPRIRDYTEAAHAAGALCYYDQANLNGIFGISARARGGLRRLPLQPAQDLRQPARLQRAGLRGAGRHRRARALPAGPAHRGARRDERAPGGMRYHLDYDRPHAIGKLRAFLGNLGVVLRAYAWTMSLGARGLREVAEVRVINNNYLEAQLREIRGIGYPYAPGHRRLDQIRYSFGRAQGGHRLRHRRHAHPLLRLRRADLVHEPPPLDRAGAVHAGALRDATPRRTSTTGRRR